ncbi:MAG: Hsp20/alpha crystallin family protein [Phycisphaeraceae bacterium JB051]
MPKPIRQRTHTPDCSWELEKDMNSEPETQTTPSMELNAPDDPTGKSNCSQGPGGSWKWRSGDFQPNDSWAPTVNVYQMSRRVEVCIDISGMDVSKIDLQIQSQTLLIRGVRQAPDPRRTTDETCKILCMEIDHGPFCKEVPLPDPIDTYRIMTRYTDGYLWVTLPLRSQG